MVLSTTEVTVDTKQPNIIFNLKAINARAGYGNFVPESDVTIRRVDYAPEGLEAFGLVMAEVATGKKILPSDLGASHRAWIDFRWPPYTLRSIEYSKVLRGQFKPSA